MKLAENGQRCRFVTHAVNLSLPWEASSGGASRRPASFAHTAVGNSRQKMNMTRNTITITMLSLSGKDLACGRSAATAVGVLLTGNSGANATPRPTVSTAPMAFHQNQNTLGKNSHNTTLKTTANAAARFAESELTRGSVASRKMPRMGP